MLSRIAEQLYWIGRYTERAEDTARLLDVAQRADLEGAATLASPVALAGMLGGEEQGGNTASLIAHYCLSESPESVANCVMLARENARTVRESVTTDMWEALNSWHLHLRGTSESRLTGGGMSLFLSSMHRAAYMFTGAADGTMLREEGWHWLALGRHLERLTFACWVLNAQREILSATPQSRGATAQELFGMTTILRALSAFDPYRRTYHASIRPHHVAEFLLFDTDFPRSALWCAVRVEECAAQVGVAEYSTVPRLAGRLAAELRYRDIREVMVEGLEKYTQRILGMAADLHAALSDTAFARGEEQSAVRSTV